MKKNFLKTARTILRATALSAGAFLGACANSPSLNSDIPQQFPQDTPEAAEENSLNEGAPSGNQVAAPPQTTPAKEVSNKETVKNNLSSTNENLANQSPSQDIPKDISASRSESGSVIPSPSEKQSSSPQSSLFENASPADSIKKIPDPYQEFPALANQVFAYADTLYQQGLVDSAVTYLQRFRIIKPLWNQWEQVADSMLQEFGKTNAERAKQFEPLALQIVNMNRVQSAYSMVAETADSLISLAPGDSLVRFAQEQKQIAYNNTLKKAKTLMQLIRANAEQNAQFAQAEKDAQELLMRYRDFEEELKIQELMEYIRSLAQSTSEEAIKYWESHNPKEALEQASKLIEGKKYSQAKELLNKLKASNLRKEAMVKYTELADAFCTVQRKETSQLFGKAQKQKDPEKKKALIQSAIAPLDKCLAEFPESSQKQKVLDNRKFLEKELSK